MKNGYITQETLAAIVEKLDRELQETYSKLREAEEKIKNLEAKRV